MGYSVSAYVVFGVKRDMDELQQMVRVRGCEHPETKGKFCPECGKPMFIEEEAELGLDWESSSRKLGIFSSQYESSEQIVGFILNNVDMYDNGAQRIGAIRDDMEEQIVEWFQSKGLPLDEDEIDHYVILHQSA